LHRSLHVFRTFENNFFFQRLVGFSLPTFFDTIRFVDFLYFFLRAPALTLDMFPCFGCQTSRSETITRIVHFAPTTIYIT
jgi:hypothetical protein